MVWFPSSISVCDVVFFFQAEDGIRYWSVTGVQTCALPIFVQVPFFFWGALLNSPLTVNRFRPRGAVVSVLQKKKGTWTMLMRDRLRKRTGTARKSRRQSLLVRGFWQCVTRLPRQSRSFIGRRLAVMSACFAEWATKWAPWRHGILSVNRPA